MQYPFADGHCDFLSGVCARNYDIAHPVPGQQIALPYLQEGNVRLQFFAMWPFPHAPKSAREQCLEMLSAYEAMLAAHPAFSSLTPDFDPTGDKIAAVLTIEGGEAIEQNLGLLHDFFQKGVRALTLTWNYPNAIAHPGTEPDSPGLTAFGREVVREMNALGMAIDVSHLNNAGIDDLLRLSTQPIFASHSNARALCPHSRCLSDAHIRAIADMGGVVGVNFFDKHLVQEGRASSRDILAHLRHVIEVGGVHAACIGTDFDGMQNTPTDLPNSSGMQRIAEGLSKIGLSPAEIRRVTYENLRDYILQFGQK